MREDGREVVRSRGREESRNRGREKNRSGGWGKLEATRVRLVAGAGGGRTDVPGGSRRCMCHATPGLHYWNTLSLYSCV